jgi:hypothetical protein
MSQPKRFFEPEPMHPPAPHDPSTVAVVEIEGRVQDHEAYLRGRRRRSAAVHGHAHQSAAPSTC